MKKESERAGLKLNIQEAKIMAYDPITSWQIDGKTMATVMDFIFFSSKITVDAKSWLTGKDPDARKDWGQ